MRTSPSCPMSPSLSSGHPLASGESRSTDPQATPHQTIGPTHVGPLATESNRFGHLEAARPLPVVVSADDVVSIAPQLGLKADSSPLTALLAEFPQHSPSSSKIDRSSSRQKVPSVVDDEAVRPPRKRLKTSVNSLALEASQLTNETLLKNNNVLPPHYIHSATYRDYCISLATADGVEWHYSMRKPDFEFLKRFNRRHRHTVTEAVKENMHKIPHVAHRGGPRGSFGNVSTLDPASLPSQEIPEAGYDVLSEVQMCRVMSLLESTTGRGSTVAHEDVRQQLLSLLTYEASPPKLSAKSSLLPAAVPDRSLSPTESTTASSCQSEGTVPNLLVDWSRLPSSVTDLLLQEIHTYWREARILSAAASSSPTCASGGVSTAVNALSPTSGDRPLLRRYWPSCSQHDTSAFGVFRPRQREKMTLRRQRRHVKENSVRIDKLDDDLNRVLRILHAMKLRDIKKLQITQTRTLQFEEQRRSVLCPDYRSPLIALGGLVRLSEEDPPVPVGSRDEKDEAPGSCLRRVASVGPLAAKDRGVDVDSEDEGGLLPTLALMEALDACSPTKGSRRGSSSPRSSPMPSSTPVRLPPSGRTSSWCRKRVQAETVFPRSTIRQGRSNRYWMDRRVLSAPQVLPSVRSQRLGRVAQRWRASPRLPLVQTDVAVGRVNLVETTSDDSATACFSLELPHSEALSTPSVQACFDHGDFGGFCLNVRTGGGQSAAASCHLLDLEPPFESPLSDLTAGSGSLSVNLFVRRQRDVDLISSIQTWDNHKKQFSGGKATLSTTHQSSLTEEQELERISKGLKESFTQTLSAMAVTPSLRTTTRLVATPGSCHPNKIPNGMPDRLKTGHQTPSPTRGGSPFVKQTQISHFFPPQSAAMMNFRQRS